MYEEMATMLFKPGFDISIATYPGHGPGDDPKGKSLCSYRTHVEDLIKERSWKEEHPFVLIAHSMGGAVALCAAVGNPKVMGVILINPAPTGGISIGKKPFMRLASRPLWYRAVHLALIRDESFVFHDDDAKELFLNGHEPRDSLGRVHAFEKESGLAVWQLAMGTFSVDPQDVRCPVHVFCGEEDRLIDPKVQRRIADTYGTFHSLPGASHMPMFDPNKEETYAAIRTTLEEIVFQKPHAPRSVAKVA